VKLFRLAVAAHSTDWVVTNDLAQDSEHAVYRVKPGLLDNYLCQQLKNPSIKMRFA
jgi:hypothetical protein